MAAFTVRYLVFGVWPANRTSPRQLALKCPGRHDRLADRWPDRASLTLGRLKTSALVRGPTSVNLPALTGGVSGVLGSCHAALTLGSGVPVGSACD